MSGKVCDECGYLIAPGHEHDQVQPNHVVRYWHPECCPECREALGLDDPEQGDMT